MSTTTREIDAPQLRATQLVARPGALPTITIPMARSVVPEVGAIWAYLAEPAEFFGIGMPSLGDLAAAISVFVKTFRNDTALVATNVTISEVDHAPQILVTGSAVRPLRRDAVYVGGPPVPPIHRESDPWWRRMAARTTSRAETDQCERWLNGRGLADGVGNGQPLLGALVFEIDGRVVGVENSEPTSILDQLALCGAIAAVDRIAGCPSDADRAWWLSPRYETHPVAELDGTPFAVEPEAVPAFARWS